MMWILFASGLTSFFTRSCFLAKWHLQVQYSSYHICYFVLLLRYILLLLKALISTPVSHKLSISVSFRCPFLVIDEELQR